MDSQGKGLIKALENWAKKVTDGYRDVNVRDMSSSFRDGLAFCAIIHKYRPDLIDFDSLSKGNILENNQLAFSVAEKQLGVPALLDAEDMVQYTKPDRLSIITYLSQLHNCFENQNKVKSGFKRIQHNNAVGPPKKIIAAEPKLLSTRRVEVCQVCNNRVFILERLIVDGKLYHTACFKCCKCQSLLNPGAYVESDVPGKYECSVCLPDEKSIGMDTDDSESFSSLEDKNASLNSIDESSHPIKNNFVPKSPFSEVVTKARTNFLENSLSPKTNRVSLPKSEVILTANKEPTSPPEKEILSNGVSVKDKISAFEFSNKTKSPEIRPTEISPSIKIKESLLSSTPNQSNSLSKSPKPSVRLSLISPSSSEKSENSLQNNLQEKTISPLRSVQGLNISNFDKNSKKETSDSISSCDKTPSKSESSEIISDTNDTTQLNSSNKIENSSKPLEKSSIAFRRHLGEYKSPLKATRDIFQTNIQPLRLSIPTINASGSKDPSSLPATLSRSESAKFPTEISQIRSAQPRTLSRPLSFSTLPNTEISIKTLEAEKGDVDGSKNNITPRRRSLEINKSSDVTDSKSLFSNSSNSEINSLDSISCSSEINNKDVSVKSENKGMLVNSASSSSLSKISPIPSIRLSLDTKKFDFESKSDVKSMTDILSPSPFNKSPEKSNEEVPPFKPSVSKDSKPDLPSKPPPPPTSEPEESEEKYPDDLNPFGDDEPENEEYPVDLNPFGDEDEQPPPSQPKVFEGVSADNYDESKNPFASDEEEAESASYQTPSPRPSMSQNSSPFNTMSSPTGSLRGTTKKRKAPKPPRLSDIFPNESMNDTTNSVKTSPAVNRRGLETPSPKLRKSKPAPPPPPVPSPRQSAQTDTKSSKDAANMQIKSSDTKVASSQEPKKKKRPAPPVPIPMQKNRKKIPLKEIIREMKEIETKQREFEKQGREIELLIRDRDKDEEPSVEEEEYIMQLFELVNQKNALFRRQAELMYIKRSQRLEEQQEQLEKQIRELMAKPESEKTDEDRAKEEELIYELTDIVDQRNSIIDSIEMDRRRELEEDVTIQEHIEIKNGDLPIAAEIKEKNKGKQKKDKKEKKKEKKEKKKDKHGESGESGKHTLRRKLFK